MILYIQEENMAVPSLSFCYGIGLLQSYQPYQPPAPLIGSANQKIEFQEFSPLLLKYVGSVKVFLKPP